MVIAGELPVRLIDQPGGPVLRCLCGAEAATLRRGAANRSMLGLRGSGPAQLRAGPDLSPAAVALIAAHARGCERGREVQRADPAEQWAKEIWPDGTSERLRRCPSTG